ncbi:MAG: cytochrome C oxidase Cbb3 [Planctomycetes bacterium]|nr:cytochrome C oxidase Cbb3 [Planctomycetota bacterium]
MTDDPQRDKLFEHEYDGIREYDNPMPGWWVAIFWLTILFAFPYITWYHVGKGDSVHDNYEAELAAYAQQLLATYGELEADEPTILRFMDDSVAMTGMASLFKSKCTQCHLADGSGNVGPNLTDDHWINVKTLTDIYSVINEGVIAKGMPEWQGKLTDTEIVLLSAYVAQLRRNPLPDKAPQGDPIAAWPEAPPPP